MGHGSNNNLDVTPSNRMLGVPYSNHMYKSNMLELPGSKMGIGASINSVNSFQNGVTDHNSLVMASMMQGSNVMMKSNNGNSSGGPSRLLGFADRLKHAHDKQRKDRQETVI
jgi:hypothetical protein